MHQIVRLLKPNTFDNAAFAGLAASILKNDAQVQAVLWHPDNESFIWAFILGTDFIAQKLQAKYPQAMVTSPAKPETRMNLPDEFKRPAATLVVVKFTADGTDEQLQEGLAKFLLC